MSMTEDADLLFRSSSGNKSVRHPKSILVSLTLGGAQVRQMSCCMLEGVVSNRALYTEVAEYSPFFGRLPTIESCTFRVSWTERLQSKAPKIRRVRPCLVLISRVTYKSPDL
jgi:hypothetical protein